MPRPFQIITINSVLALGVKKMARHLRISEPECADYMVETGLHRMLTLQRHRAKKARKKVTVFRKK